MKILLLDDHQMILESLSMLLKSLEEVNHVSCFETPEEALEACLENEYDVVITDYEMPEMNGASFSLKLRKTKPHVNILMLTISEQMETIRACFQAGILGYVMKKASKNELKEAINTVAAGKRYISESVLTQLLNPENNLGDYLKEDRGMQALTSREIDVVEHIGKEMSTKEIAEALFVSVATIEKHRHNILRKLGVKNSIGILKYAFRHGLVTE